MANGDVKLTLGSEQIILKCTLEAFQTIPAYLEGFVGAFTKLQQADVNACVTIIAWGSGKGNEPREHRRLAELLFDTGIGSVIPLLKVYVENLCSGASSRAEAQSGNAGE